MHALCYHGPRDIRYERVAAAKLEDDRDVLVRMEACGICGSDLHIYHGHGFSELTGYSVGHEAVGEVMEIGRDVRGFKPGDKVMVSGAVGCGACAACLAGNVINCRDRIHSPLRVYGLGLELAGCQAEAIRVPAGDTNLSLIPDGVTRDQALLLTDNLPTAWYGCRNARIKPGQSVVVIGLGPIGLMAVESAFVQGASQVFAIDPIPERRAIATSLGATVLHPDNAEAEIREATRGRMVDAAVEAVGAGATIHLALRLVTNQGTVSVIGVNQDARMEFPMGEAFMRSLTFRIGLCSVPLWWPELVPLVQKGRLHPERFITHQLPLVQGDEAYRLFATREDGAIKTIMTAD